MKECILDLCATFRGKIFISIRRCGFVRFCIKQLVSTSVQRDKKGKEGVRTLAFAIFETRTWEEFVVETLISDVWENFKTIHRFESRIVNIIS